MKKFIAMLLALAMVLAFAGCAAEKPPETTAAPEPEAPVVETEAPVVETEAPAETEAAATVMSYAEFAAAELDTEVTVETYVQTIESWWDGKCHIYAQSEDGGYYIYGYECTEDEAAALVPGTKILVKGWKTAWEGEVEIMDATIEVLEGSYIVEEAFDATALLGTDDLIKHQNKLAKFTDMTVVSIEYKNGQPGDDIYVTLSKDGASYSFCVERYLTGPETEVYAAVSALEKGDVVDVEGFLYWYEGVNTHITAVK